MEHNRIKFYRALLAMLLSASLVFAAAFPAVTYADDGDAPGGAETESPHIGEIWVVPEVISGARQPASGGMFAWVTFDYYYSGEGLQNELDPDDFTLQMKAQGSEWTDVPGGNIAVLGGDEYYIAPFEAIIAAKVPENKDPLIKKWRVVYKRGTEEEILSEIIVQAADLSVSKDISVLYQDACFEYPVEQAPWSIDSYKSDHIPPIYSPRIS